MRTRTVAVPATGSFVTISATQITRRVEFLEETTQQGLAYKFNDGSTTPFTTVYTILPVNEPLVLGDPIPTGKGASMVLGNGPDASGGYTVAATRLIQLSSLTATATSVKVTEYD